MKNFIQTTLIALLISSAVFSQTKNEAVKNPSGGTIVTPASDSRLILLSPADGKLFSSSDGSKPVVFRWTAIVPKPKEAVTYRLKVWQLMQGQNSTEAMRTNQPIITKEVVNMTQAAISNLYTGPCKPPYLCNFVWAVEVFNSEGLAIGNSHAGTDSYSFKFEGENTDVVKAEGDNKGNAGNTGMAGGKSLGADGDTGFKYKTYQSGKPVYGNATQPPAPGEGIDKELGKGFYSAGKNDCCLNPCCSENAIWIDDKDEKAGTKSSKGAQLKAALYLPIEKTVYDSNGNISGIMIKSEKGEPVIVKVVVAGSNSLSGGVK